MKTVQGWVGVLAAAMGLAWATPAGAQSLWVESAGVMILPDRVAGTNGSIDRAGVRNEFVTAQLGLRSPTATTQALTFTWGALAGPGGAQIARSNITLFRAADVVVDHGDLVTESADKPRARKYGSFPDALVPLELPDGTNAANSVMLTANTTVSFWVDVFIPQGTPPGDYTGAIALKSGATTVTTIPLTVHVLNLTIPADPTIDSLFNLRFHPHVLANMDNYVAEVRKHRVQPFNYHYVDYMTNPGVGFPVLDKLNPKGKGNTALYLYMDTTTTAAQMQSMIDQIKQAHAHLMQTGLAPRTYIHLTDEPSSSIFPTLITFVQMVQQQTPYYGKKIFETAALDPPTSYFDYVQYQCRALKLYGPWYIQTPPQTPTAGRPEWDQYRRQGKHLWFYVSNAQGYPYPTFDIHAYNLPWEGRVLPWAYWYEKAEGHLYWDLMYQPVWQLNTQFPPGDGQLMYPGDLTLAGAPAWKLVNDLHRPVISRRLKHQREGLEEYELLKLAEAKIGRKATATIVETIYKEMGQRTWSPGAYDPLNPMWSYDETKWDAARTQILNALLPPPLPQPPKRTK